MKGRADCAAFRFSPSSFRTADKRPGEISKRYFTRVQGSADSDSAPGAKRGTAKHVLTAGSPVNCDELAIGGGSNGGGFTIGDAA
jgi:hypothetical protein